MTRVREWQPGEMAMARVTTRGQDKRRVRRTADPYYQWDVLDEIGGHVRETVVLDIEPLPLVTLDPEDEREVERLRVTLGADFYYGDAGALAAALREFANPTPPIEEPTGLGAVVEDAEGSLWFRMALDNISYPGEVWQPQYEDVDRWLKWSDIEAVRVLSEGVPAEVTP